MATCVAVAALVSVRATHADAVQPAAHFVWHGVNGHYIPLRGDFDGDHRSDIFWYAPGPARDSVWFGMTDRHFNVVGEQVFGSYRPVVLDVNGDGRADIVWYRPGSFHGYVWNGSANHT